MLNQQNKKGRKLGHIVSEETRKKIGAKLTGKPTWSKGKKFSKKHRKNLSIAHKWQKFVYHFTWAGKKRPPFTEEAKKNISNSLIGKMAGSKNPSWKGGITPENHLIRNSIEMRLWRESVFARDNWTDQKTGVRGGKLHAHHIENFSTHPELRFAIDNGITLSDKSHREFHKKYGTRNNNQEQLVEFLKFTRIENTR